jgi:DNA-directed RNA polymerase subunit beta
VLDDRGNEIELRDNDEDTYQPGGQGRDEEFMAYAEESEFSAAGYSLKENSDDDDYFAQDEEDAFEEDDLILDDEEFEE